MSTGIQLNARSAYDSNPLVVRFDEVCVSDSKRKRDENRYIVDIPAYVATTGSSPLWTAKATLRNVSATGLFLELPSPPPFDRGELLRIWWRDVVVTGEVRHVACRPGFVGIGVRLREVVTGSVLACAEIPSTRDGEAPQKPLPLFCSGWDIEQVERAKVVQNALSKATDVIREYVPAGSEQEAALRNIAEAARECSSAITRLGMARAERRYDEDT